MFYWHPLIKHVKHLNMVLEIDIFIIILYSILRLFVMINNMVNVLYINVFWNQYKKGVCNYNQLRC